MRVEEELERKRAELVSEMQALALRVETIKGQVSAIDQVIAVYNPAHAPKIIAAARAKRIRNNASVLVLLSRINKSEAVLEALREAGEPLSTADCTNRRVIGVIRAGCSEERLGKIIHAGGNGSK